MLLLISLVIILPFSTDLGGNNSGIVLAVSYDCEKQNKYKEQNMINDVVREFMELSQKDLANLSQSQIKNHQIALQRLAEKIKNGNTSFDLSD